MKYILEKVSTVPETMRVGQRNREYDAVFQQLIDNADEETWVKVTGFNDGKELDRVTNSLLSRNRKQGKPLEIRRRVQDLAIYVRKK